MLAPNEFFTMLHHIDICQRITRSTERQKEKGEKTIKINLGHLNKNAVQCRYKYNVGTEVDYDFMSRGEICMSIYTSKQHSSSFFNDCVGGQKGTHLMTSPCVDPLPHLQPIIFLIRGNL